MVDLQAKNIGRDTPLSDIMIREVITIQIDDKSSVVDTLMKLNPIHHLPVLEGKVLRGLISQRDLYRNMLSGAFYDSEVEQHSFLDNFTDIPSIMTRDPITLSPEQTLGEALHLVLEYRIGCLPLVNDRNEMQGIVTDSDLLRLFRWKLLDGETE
jgi:CBS-domain-containing membrane protein